MSKTRVFALLMVAFMLICILTNPSKEKFEDAISNKATTIVKQQLHYKDQGAVDLAMALFGHKTVNEFVNNNIIIKNYYLFSVATLKWEGQEMPIGGGALQTIWLSPKIDEKADEIIGVLKSL
ncbi:hypothetical protein [Sphingobacterium rhinopitheci]|uniref:hypothetical protein n=1 Tax=Sphingobacterium rhinopitheci TaxID=2781960 RepID=UPI001F51B19B|nr:hypothetical protein [Sphingobacterium rhinopitheci]MCI0921852.1 DUF4359 domain-containing protein [Sphingobacterium rhinopitheci]